MDRITPQHRSWNMSRIRGVDTRPEMVVRSMLHRLGFRFRKDSSRKLPGRPDIVLKKYRVAVFVHGCFWHRHRNCKFAYTPKSRQGFWLRKLYSNQERDCVVQAQLRRLGWRVIVIWECQIKTPKRAIETLTKKLARIRIRVNK